MTTDDLTRDMLEKKVQLLTTTEINLMLAIDQICDYTSTDEKEEIIMVILQRIAFSNGWAIPRVIRRITEKYHLV